MRHPFGGIIVSDGPSQTEKKPAEPDSRDANRRTTRQRRGVLQALCGGAAAVLAWRCWPLATSRGDDKTDTSGAYGRYLVMPKDFRKFTEKKREELGILGNHFNVASDDPAKRNRGGFLAWLSPEQAKKLAEHADVASVIPLEAADIPGPDERKQDAKQFAILLAPNSWAKRPAENTYTSAKDLVEAWNKQFAALKGVKFAVSGNDPKQPQTVTVEVPSGETPKELVEGLKNHAQVVGLLWLNPTTLMIGEEGGVTTQALGEEGGPTTKALGEEGGPTTERVGEEATTLALGEEGGPTTRAIGEEGGPTTRALGEEGNPLPRQQTAPGPTTQALGEEGGR